VSLVEVVNPPIVVGLERGTRHPEHDLQEPRLERIFERVLADERPDVVHVQELLGFPSSILDIAAGAGVPVVMTLQDYFPLCATVRLWDSDGRVCLRREVGEDCALRNARAPEDAGELIHDTMHFELARLKQRVPGVRRLDFAPLRGLVEPAVRLVARPGSAPAERAPEPLPNAGAFQRRRELNMERLGRVERLVAQSTRVAEIYRQLGVSGDRLEILHLTLAHIGELTPRPPREPKSLTFGTLGGFIGPSKGSELLLETLERLHADGHGGSFRLLALGPVHHDAAPRLTEFPEVELLGRYDRWELDRLLDEVDVGIMPSVWEEAYGFAGLELLAKGIPVVANRLGGMVDYVRDGETGWLNDSCSAGGLAAILLRLIENPGEVEAVSRSALAARDSLVKPFERHVGEIEGVYREVMRAPARPGPR
jgi:glycosyltransferase involved in cell wall biosynthesis